MADGFEPVMLSLALLNRVHLQKPKSEAQLDWPESTL